MKTGVPAGGAWGLTAVMVVITSWVLYRYIAPKGWREVYLGTRDKRLATEGL